LRRPRQAGGDRTEQQVARPVRAAPWGIRQHGQHLADLREAAGSIAYYTAEPWQWAALGELVAGWEPPEEPENADGVPAPSM
jgi:hypothetical protein